MSGMIDFGAAAERRWEKLATAEAARASTESAVVPAQPVAAEPDATEPAVVPDEVEDPVVEPPAEPERFGFTYGEEQVEFPRERAAELARLGLDYERQLDSLNAQRAQAKAELEYAQQARNFFERLKNPAALPGLLKELREAGVDLRVAGEGSGAGEGWDDDGGGTAGGPSGSASQDRVLEQRIQQLEAQLQQRAATERQAELTRQIDTEIGGHFSDKAAQDLLRRNVLFALSGSPQASVKALVAVEAKRLRTVLEASTKASASKAAEKQKLKTVKPSEGVPGALGTEPERPRARDLRNGNFERRVSARLANLLRPQ